MVGYCEYRKDIDHFKYKSKWDRPVDEVVKKLTPYFEVDYLLPRTFLGSLNLDMLYSIVTAYNIPPDITLASTCYYIKGYNSNKELIKKLAKHVARKSISENLDISTPGLISTYRTYKIAANLLEESLKFRISNEPIHLPAIEVFLKSSDAYDKIQNKLDLSKNELKQINISKDGHLRKLEDFKGRIVHWLSEDIHYKELDFLKAVNKCDSFDWRNQKDERCNMRLGKLFHSKALTEECQNLLKRFEEVIQSFITALIQGNISIKILRKLISRSVSFQKILIAMKNEKSEAIMMTLNIRLRELEAFDNTYQIVQEFTYVCIHCKEELDILPKILECCKSLLFMKIWEKKGLEQQKQLGRNVGMNEVFEKVWQPALEQWKTLSKKLKTGEMFFTEFEKWFRTKDSSTLKKEFRLLDNVGDTSWIKKDSGLKELKVFVDLASISAGEGDMEIAKVNCLHSATTGYAPLIFNLEKECDTKMFLEKCEVVWKELVPNPQLPQKLLDTTRQLDWLQSVKKSHGSVEVTSLAQAEAINGKGIYQVGNLEKKTFLKIPELTDVLELRVPEEEGNMAQRNHYRYDQLHDLQSRLMLVAGKAEKGKDDVDRKACAFINFGFGEERLTLKGRIDEENHDVSFIIPKLARFLEQCHEKWLDYIDQKREKYYCLNFFTIDQMVILQQELVKLGSAQEPAALIYPLLSAVKHGCTKDDLVKAMSAAKLDVDRADTERETEKEMEDKDNKEEKVEVSDDLKTQIFFNEMTKSGYPLGLAREALKHVEADDIDGGIVWCMDNEDEYGTEEQSMSETAPDEVPDFHGWTQTDQSLASITEGLVIQLVGVGSRENSVDKLIKTLEDLWKTFLVSISSSVSDYLSVEHLGIILNRLNEQDDFTVNRMLHPCFTAGEPNLLICNQSDIYNTVLSVYSHEVDRPLPQSDEVLLCTPTTTLDMIEIFWRRALFANNDRVYCLVNADLLNYDECIKYRLVVICSSENEYRSRIVAALDKYHKPPLHTDVNMVRKYLLTKFKVDKSDKEWTLASTVDYERYKMQCSYFVKSWRAGVGKSLYKKRMVENLVKQVSSTQNSITIPLHEKTLNNDEITDVFREEILPPQKYRPRIFHIDISHEVQEGVDVFLFQLLILGCIGHSSGYVWRRSELDYYIIESMPLLARDTDVHVKEYAYKYIHLPHLRHCGNVV
ncbi:RNF213 [Mytilus edulis]|uniref:RNF213 n=1 Tax=Mytilus edulis TaxID=6550 RepID=A0A8S3UTZ8_MYTED|nr:RNF213 [Mytilus edulis]